MDQREFVTKGEGSNRFGLLLTLYLDDLDDMFAESRDFGAIVLQWHRTRGAAAGSIILTAVAAENYHHLIVDWYAQMHARDSTLRAVFATVPFQLELLNPRGRKLVDLTFQTTPVSGLQVEKAGHELDSELSA